MFTSLLNTYKSLNTVNAIESQANNEGLTLVMIDGTVITANVNKMNSKGLKVTTTHNNGIVKTTLILNDATKLVVLIAKIIHSLNIVTDKQDDTVTIENKTYLVTITNDTDCEGYFTANIKLKCTNVSTSYHLAIELKAELLNQKGMAANRRYIKKNFTPCGMLPNYHLQFAK